MGKKELKKFKNQELASLVQEISLPPKSDYKNIQAAIQRKLKILLDAEKWKDLQIFPNNKPEKLKSSQVQNLCSLRINDKYRLLFIWENNQAWEIDINKHDKKYGK